MLAACKSNNNSQPADTTNVEEQTATVYMTRQISPEALVKIYEPSASRPKVAWQ